MEILKKKLFCIKMWEIPCVNLYMIDNTKFLRPYSSFSPYTVHALGYTLYFVFMIID